MSTSSSWTRRFLVNAALTAASLAVAFGVGEVVARLLFKDSTVLFPRYHTEYHYGKYTLRGIRPHAQFWHTSVDGSWKFVTDAEGFRDTRDFAYAKSPGTLRILSLGDSHTQGYEVRQDATFSAVAERYLKHHQLKAEAINAGVSGFGNGEELAFLEAEGYKYHPDVVVLGFYANDFEDNFKSDLFGLDAAGKLKPLKYEHIPGVKIQDVIYAIAPVRWLSENSYFYSVLFNGVWEYFKARLAKAAHAAETAEYAVPMQKGPSAPEIALAAALLEEMQRFCTAHGMRLIVVDIPQRAAEYSIASSIPPALMQRLNGAGVEVINSASLLADYDGAPEMHVPHGHQHISEFTHALIGVEIGRRVLGAQPGGTLKAAQNTP
jgi:lysophospholipase L1-like esterase